MAAPNAHATLLRRLFPSVDSSSTNLGNDCRDPSQVYLTRSRQENGLREGDQAEASRHFDEVSRHSVAPPV